MLVSVIIPCYNVEEYITECVHSVLAQTYSNIEIICVDNNSTDGTFYKLTELALQYPAKLNILTEKNKGAPAARNKGLSAANGEWIQFLDADDLLLPDKINHQVKLILHETEAGFVAGGFFRQDINSVRTEVKYDGTDPFKAIFITKLGNTCANLFKTSPIKKIGGWDPTLKSSQETNLMFGLLKEGHPVIFDPVPLTVIRQRPSGQISQQEPKSQWLRYIQLRIEIIEYLKLNKKDYFEKEYDFFYQSLFKQVERLWLSDKASAVELFNKHFPNDFTPSGLAFGLFYSFIFKIAGFEKTLSLKNFVRHMVPFNKRLI